MYNRRNHAMRAAQLFERACGLSWCRRLRAILSRKARRLLDLSAIEAACPILGSRFAGSRTVPITLIKGSEGRSDDFDGQFHPRQAHSRQRWINIAAARLDDVALPPVDLIQVGGVYFVRDGHHRISVARALGEQSIDAVVTIWDVAGPLPWRIL
jgi:hypothetical protein